MMEWLAFAGIMALGQFSPGPDMVLLTRTALASGSKAGTWTAFGIACGLAVHAGVAVTGVALVLFLGSWLVALLKWLAVGYLAWLAYRLICGALKNQHLEMKGGVCAEMSAFGYWRRGFLCAVGEECG